MATAKRLPSGSYRARVYSHTENGKKIYKAFVAPSKKEAEMLAAAWANNKDLRKHSDLTVGEAIDGYIRAKEGVLSPSTVRAYKIMLKNSYEGILGIRLDKLTSVELQRFVSDLSKEKSSKYVRNVYALLSASVALFEPDKVFRVTLPAKVPKRPVSPSDEDVAALFDAAPEELKKCIALAAFGSLRRGEICALTFADLDGDILHVTKDMVQDSEKNWVIKNIPKTAGSIREVRLPDTVIKLLGSGNDTDRIIKYSNPGSITRYFTRLRDKLGTSVRFHDLRHYFASIGAVLNIPDTYLADFGGWQRGSSVMKTVYQNNITSMSEVYSEKMRKHFDNLMSKES